MITDRNIIVTGKVGAGKTHFIQSHMDELSGSIGYFSPSDISKKKYFLENIQNHMRYPAFIEGSHDMWNVYGRFSYDQKLFDVCNRNILDNCSSYDRIVLDEIGRIELYQNKGFHDVMKNISDLGIPYLITARDDIIDDIVEKYHLSGYAISAL